MRQTLNTKSFYILVWRLHLFSNHFKKKEVINAFRTCKQSQGGYISFLPSLLNLLDGLSLLRFQSNTLNNPPQAGTLQWKYFKKHKVRAKICSQKMKM